MAISFVQYDDYYNSSYVTTIANNTALNTTTGNFLVVTVANYQGVVGEGVVTGITDTAGNTYVKAIGGYRNEGSSGERCEIWYAEDITGNANNITTATYEDDAAYNLISVSEYSGVATSSSLLDTSFNSRSSTTSHYSGTATSTSTGDLIIGVYKGVGSETITLGSGFSTLSSDLTFVLAMVEYKILGASGNYQANCTTSTTQSSLMQCAIFAVAAAVGTNMKINIGDVWKDVDSMKINIGDTWKDVVEVKQNIGDVWKVVY